MFTPRTAARLLPTAVFILALASCGEDSGFIEKTISDSEIPPGDDALGGSSTDETTPGRVVLPTGTPVGTRPPVPSPSLPALPQAVLVIDTDSIVLADSQSRSLPVSVRVGGEGGEILPVDSDVIEVAVLDPGIVNVWFEPGDGTIQIEGLTPGQTVVEVTYGDSQQIISVQVVPGIPVIRLGVNFEDIPSGGDLDYNDAVFCFSGKFAHDDRSVVSLAEQIVRVNVTNRSGCDHDIAIGVIDPDGTRREIPIFRSRSEPTLDMLFHPGSRLDVRMLVAGSCRKADSFWVAMGTTVPVAGPNFGKPLVEVLNDVCRTTGS